MLTQMIDYLIPTCSVRKSPRLSRLLVLLLCLQFAQTANAQAVSDKLQFGAALGQKPVAGVLDKLKFVGHPQQNPQEFTTLELGKRVERELAGGQKHNYQIALSDGQYASVIVEQRGIDVLVNVAGSDGKLITSFASKVRGDGREKAELVAETTGSYQFSVEARLKSAPAGRYEIRLEELRPANRKDVSVHQARKLYREAYDLYWTRTDLDRARLLAERSLQLFENSEGPEHPDVAATLTTLAWIHNLESEPEIAESMLRRALTIREKALGPEHLDVADSLSQLGLFWWKRGYYARAEALTQRALAVREKVLGRDHLDVAGTLNGLAFIEVDIGNYAAAKPLYQRALEIRERLLGRDDLGVAKSLEDLADVYAREGDFAMAESLYQRALAICEKIFGGESEWVAHMLSLLADIYTESGDYTRAGSLYQRSLEIREKIGEAGQHHIGHALYKLGRFSFKTADYAQAEKFHLRAIAVWEKNTEFGPDLPDIALALEDLGQVYRNGGDYVRAEAVFLRALAIIEKNSGLVHPHVALILNQLANLYSDGGDYQRAEPLYQRALEIWEDANGPDYPGVAQALGNLARVYLAKGDVARTVDFQSRANAIDERNTALNLATGSERWKLSYLSTLSKDTDRTISLHVRFAVQDPVAARLAVSAIIQRKGRVQDAMSEGLVALRRRFSPQDQALLDRLNDTTAQLARLVLNGPGGMNAAEHRQRIKTLDEQREKIEEEISSRSAGFYERSQPVTLAAVQAAIPKDATLIEFDVYRLFDPKKPDNKTAYGEPHYAAYVINHQGEVRWAELGAAKEIDDALDAWRQALRDPQRTDVLRLAREVDEKVMQPVRALTGDATQLLISPDGELNLIPFAALVDEQGRYLIQHYSFTYLTSGRDLLRMQVAREAKSNPLVVANPSFGEPAAELLATTAKPSVPVNRRRSVTTGRDLSEVYFAPLGGTAQEARSIQTLFPDANVLSAAQATESAVKQVNAPRILHLATHGFFLSEPGAIATGSPPNATTQAGTRGIGSVAPAVAGGSPPSVNTQPATRGINANAKIANPLLRSGLALAGANLHNKNSNDDGILTALEASGLNLWGTKLVVLSACDTGIGEVRNGEGVYGLRRAFVLAGAESLVMSLWPVSDYSTRELMTNYYRNLKQGMGRGASLRQVQLDMLKRNSKLHPFYWANFIQSGEWANLDGKR